MYLTLNVDFLSVSLVFWSNSESLMLVICGLKINLMCTGLLISTCNQRFCAFKLATSMYAALSISTDSRRKLLATWEKISNHGRLLSCLAKCFYVGNLPNSTGQAGYFSIHGLLLLNLLKGLVCAVYTWWFFVWAV